MLDFQKRQKKYFDVVLHDGSKLKIPPPTKRIYDDMVKVQQNPDTAAKDLLELLRTILATNKEKIQITEEQLAKFDIEDIYEFFINYANFVSDILSDPNSKSPIVR